MEVDVRKVLGYVQFGHRETDLQHPRVRKERDGRVVQAARVVAEAAQGDPHVAVRDVEDLELPEASLGVGQFGGRAPGPTRVQVCLSGAGGRLPEAHVVQVQPDPFPDGGLEAVDTGEVLRTAPSMEEDVPGRLDFSASRPEDPGAEWRVLGVGGRSTGRVLLVPPLNQLLPSQSGVDELVMEAELGRVEGGSRLGVEFNFLEWMDSESFFTRG